MHIAYDAMHKGNRVEVNLLKSSYGFVKETMETILDVNKLLGYGKNLALAKEVSAELGLLLLQMNRLPDTRMANYKGAFTLKFVRSYPAITATLHRLNSSLTSSSRDKKNKETVTKLIKRISSYDFIKNLCALLDIYKVTGQIQQVVQIVNILPHVKYQKFQDLTTHLDKMSRVVSLDLCDCTIFDRERSSSRSSSEAGSPAKCARLRSPVSMRSRSPVSRRSRSPDKRPSISNSRSKSPVSMRSRSPVSRRSRSLVPSSSRALFSQMQLRTTSRVPKSRSSSMPSARASATSSVMRSTSFSRVLSWSISNANASTPSAMRPRSRSSSRVSSRYWSSGRETLSELRPRSSSSSRSSSSTRASTSRSSSRESLRLSTTRSRSLSRWRSHSRSRFRKPLVFHTCLEIKKINKYLIYGSFCPSSPHSCICHDYTVDVRQTFFADFENYKSYLASFFPKSCVPVLII